VFSKARFYFFVFILENPRNTKSLRVLWRFFKKVGDDCCLPETECLLGKQTVVTETPASSRIAKRPHPGTSRRTPDVSTLKPLGYLKHRYSQSIGTCGEAGVEQRPIIVPLETPAYEMQIDITRQ
jgi:hypothetical protein